MKVVIFGCGRLGSTLAHMLDDEGHEVTVLDPDAEKFERLRQSFGGRKLTGIGINEDFLRRAGLQEAGAFLALSGDDRAGGDNTNVMASQIAKHIFKVPVVISQIKDPLRKDTYDTLGIDTFCPTTLGSELMMEAIGDEV
jgi:trk system potassium uptake protein TrkA